ncbi:hypothetical protein [Kaarinaea lacus]
MKQKQSLFLMIGMALCFWASNSFALGLGLAVGKGTEEWEDNDTSFYDGDREVSNIGFVLDTAVAKNKVFNYRLTLMSEENKIDTGGRVNLKGYAMTHDFGFGVFRNKHVRLWLGPQLKGAYYEEMTNSSGLEIGDAVGFGLSAVAGVNVHLPKVVSFGFTAGYQVVGAYAGSYDSDFVDDLDVNSSGPFFSASLIFRIDDDY